jgi:hypothetical protein
MSNTSRRLALASLMLFAGTAAAVDDAVLAPVPATGTLQLRSGTIDTAALPNLLDAAALPAGAPIVLVFEGPMTDDRRAALTRAGVTLRDYLPTDSFVATLSPDATPAALRRVPGLVRAVALDASWKTAPDLGTAPAVGQDRLDLAARGEFAAAIWLVSGLGLADALPSINATPGVRVVDTALEGDAWAVTVAMTPAAAGALAAIPAVLFIDNAPEFALRNTTSNWIVQSGTTNVTPLWNSGLTGQGSIIAVIDGLPDIEHCSFFDPVNPVGPLHRKVEAINGGSFTSFHGTHVAATVLGDAGNANDTRGIAYQARLVYHTYPSTSESSMFGRLDLHRGQGAFVHSNSWGTENTNAYNGTTRAIDNFSWTNDDNLVVFAVSNGSLIRNPENAKNCLAVAASGDTPSQGNWCIGGRGPTNDGRRKPEVLAPGCGIRSASSGTTCGTDTSTGTSMATPAVSAIAALTRQYFTAGYYPSGAANAPDAFEPSGALLKAMVVNSAVDMPGVSGFPGNVEGWGRVLADNALFFPGDTRRLLVAQARNNQPGSLSTGGLFALRVRVTDPAQPLKITLAFHDAPGAVNTAFAPVNNLDLVANPLGQPELLGNVFAGGFSDRGGVADAINNLEQVLVTAPQTGAWLVRVAAPAVNVGAQGFALVVTGGVEALCPADFNGDGFVDFFDYDSFVTAYENADPFADTNADGFLDFFDYDDFVAAFEAGC